ncbi:MAG: response regulator transcription factor [Cyclobacteriaceae bacterium]|nr:response regulator transcription factor [Cyclobacteriaceae bacterium]
MKVLVCDDDEVVLKVIQVALEAEHLEVKLARDGNQALALLSEYPDIDLIITDIHMPHRNGDEILTQVRADKKRKIPIMMISSDSDEDVVKMALRLGVDEFLPKPVDPKVVKQKVKKLLKT